jgi:hypothetical protein
MVGALCITHLVCFIDIVVNAIENKVQTNTQIVAINE